MKFMLTYRPNANGEGREETVEAESYSTTTDGVFIDFVAWESGKLVKKLRVKADAIERIEKVN